MAEPPTAKQSAISIEDLPEEILDYIFSFLDFVQRCRIEEVCKRWRHVAGRPTHLRLDVDFIQNRKMDNSILCTILSRSGPTLKQLTIKSNIDLTCESLTKIGSYCPNLVSLELHLLGNRQMSCLKKIVPHCPNLRVLRLKNYDNINDETYNTGMLTVVKSCKALESLHISHLSKIDLSWLNEINSNLRALHLFRTGLTSEGMQCLWTRCKALEEFTLDGCNVWDPRVLFQLLKHFRRSLRILRISYEFYWNLDWSEAIQDLVHLEVLQLFCCDLVDDALMEVLASNCVKLRSLDIGFTDVTDAGLVHLQRLPLLKELKLDERTKITGKGLEMLISKGVMQQVTIPAYDSELNEACRQMASKYPNVRFFSGRQNEWQYWGESRPKRHFAR